jgi:hypothetical protein
MLLWLKLNSFPDSNFFACELIEYVSFTAEHKKIYLCNAAVADRVVYFSWVSLKIMGCELWNIIITVKSIESFVCNNVFQLTKTKTNCIVLSKKNPLAGNIRSQFKSSTHRQPSTIIHFNIILVSLFRNPRRHSFHAVWTKIMCKGVRQLVHRAPRSFLVA